MKNIELELLTELKRAFPVDGGSYFFFGSYQLQLTMVQVTGEH